MREPMKQVAVVVLWICTVLLPSEGWFGLFDGVEERQHTVRTLNHTCAARHSQWAGYWCEGHSDDYEGGA